MADVFLSYAHQDSETAEEIASFLRSSGIEVWQDKYELNAGDILSSKIRAAIRETKNYVTIISKNSRGSNFQSSELAAAIAATEADPSRKIIPIVVEDGVELPPFLRRRLYLKMAPGDDKNSALATLLKSINAPSLANSSSQALEINDSHLSKWMLEQLGDQEDYFSEQARAEAETRQKQIRKSGYLTILAAFVGILGALTAFLGFRDATVVPEIEGTRDAIRFLAGIVTGIFVAGLANVIMTSSNKSKGGGADE